MWENCHLLTVTAKSNRYFCISLKIQISKFKLKHWHFEADVAMITSLDAIASQGVLSQWNVSWFSEDSFRFFSDFVNIYCCDIINLPGEKKNHKKVLWTSNGFSSSAIIFANNSENFLLLHGTFSILLKIK